MVKALEKWLFLHLPKRLHSTLHKLERVNDLVALFKCIEVYNIARQLFNKHFVMCPLKPNYLVYLHTNLKVSVYEVTGVA